MKLIKAGKVDKIIWSIIALAAVVLVCVCAFYPGNAKRVNIRVDGEVVKSFDLDTDREYTINGYHNGTNILVINNHEAFIKHASCPDKLCQKQGKISKVGQSLICIPNRVVVEVSDDNIQVDEVAK